MSPEVLLAGAFILLHRPGGAEILIAPQHITTLIAERPGPQPPGRLITIEGHCVVTMTDRKYFAVIETCQVVQRLIDEALRK